MADWTPARVEKRLRKTIALRAALSKGGRRIRLHALSAEATGIGIIGVIGGIGVADCDAVIATAVEARSWLDWLDRDDAALVQARLEGARWKMICWRFGISRPTAYRRWRHALGIIAWRLNGNSLPSGCSRRRFMQIAAGM